MDLSDIVRPEFALLWLGLLALGAMLKYWAKDKDGNRLFDPNLIPLALYVFGIAVGAATWAADHSGVTGWPWWYHVVITGGLLNGGAAAFFANGGWDLVHGLWKFGTRKPEAGYATKILGGTMHLTDVPEEVRPKVRDTLMLYKTRIGGEVGE